MRKILLSTILFIICISICAPLFAQVGINTTLPQGILHIDAQSNTSGTTNTRDDVIILENGNVGLGILSPSVKLHIVSVTQGGGFALQDGTQGANYILVSDADGNAFWKESEVSEFTVISSENSSTSSFTAASYTYDPGLRLIFPRSGTYSISIITRLTMNRAASAVALVRVYLAPLAASLSFPGAAQVIGSVIVENNIYQSYINQNIEVNATTGLTARLVYSVEGQFTAASGTLQASWSGTHIRVK
ncbi:hypothetical protein [Dysgonomonas macrotermitis]|uniref:C1q domain-containing protein n=1 Tax=Dysgonomonas macrotermitis TaxID=1346286 RepID=A0A1M5HKX3_9BACT|nr:hypothetical protein [Dysgonomonas macrotermitis]SHG16551.1 hypothetical protein SAMN05444362_11696 [Dysgonomonas macrotermitis]